MGYGSGGLFFHMLLKHLLVASVDEFHGASDDLVAAHRFRRQR